MGRLQAAAIRRLAERNAIVIDADRRDRAARPAPAEHGRHGAAPTRWRTARRGSSRARPPVVVTPTIPFGMSEHHMSLSGTITLDYATMEAVVRCVVSSAIRQGFKPASSC